MAATKWKAEWVSGSGVAIVDSALQCVGSVAINAVISLID